MPSFQKARFWSLSFLTSLGILVGISCKDFSAPNSSDISARVFLVHSSEKGYDKSRNREFRHDGKAFVINHDARLLSDENGRSIRIPQEALEHLEATFERITVMQDFFHKLNNDPAYQACLKAGKHSRRKLSLQYSQTSNSYLRSSVVSQLRASRYTEPTNTDFQGVYRPAAVVEPGSCAEWANTLSEKYTAFNAIEVNYWSLIAVAVASGVSINFFGIGWETSVPTMAGTLFSEMLNLWYSLNSLSMEIEFIRSLMVVANCVVQLPTMVITYNGGSGGAAGDKCILWVITESHSNDGGMTWYMVSQQYELRCAP